METRIPHEPVPHLVHLVGSVVVHHDMRFGILGNGAAVIQTHAGCAQLLSGTAPTMRTIPAKTILVLNFPPGGWQNQANFGPAVSIFISVFVAPLRNARRRRISTTGIVVRIAVRRNMRRLPDRSSSSMLLVGRSAKPKPASTMRFCAVRLSIGMISDALRPHIASRCSKADEYGSGGAPGRKGNVIHRSPSNTPEETYRTRASRWQGEHTGTIGSW